MRTAFLAALIVGYFFFTGPQACAQYGDIEPFDLVSYLVMGPYEDPATGQLLDSDLPESDPETSPGSEEHGLTQEAVFEQEQGPVSAIFDEIDSEVSGENQCDAISGDRRIEVAERACYVRVMSEGLACVREIRSLDICPGKSSLILKNLPTSILEDSVFLSTWNVPAGVTIDGYRLVRDNDSAELHVDISSAEEVLGAGLELNYITENLFASLSYTGFFDGKAGMLRLSEWLTVANDTGKHFKEAMFSFSLHELGFGHTIPSSVTLPPSEKRLFLSNDYILSPARTIVVAENQPGTDLYNITELIKVEGLHDRQLLIPSSPVTVYSMDTDGFVTLSARGTIHKPLEYSWFTVETLDRPDVVVQRARTGEEMTSGGSIRDVSYMINIDNRSVEPAIVTIYEYMGPGNWIVVSATVDANPVSHSRDLSRREYATFSVEVPASSSRALFYRARIPQR